MIYYIEPEHIQYGAKSNPDLQTHLQVVKSRLEAERWAHFYEPFYIENSQELKNALLASMIRLVIRSVSISNGSRLVSTPNGELTRHAKRFFQYFPHRQHNLHVDEPVNLAGHMGSLGHVSVKYKLTGEPLTVIEQILNLFWRDHGLQDIHPNQKLAALLDRLRFPQLEGYFDALESKLSEAVTLKHPLLVRNGISSADVKNLKYRLLFGELDYSLIQTIEYLQRISNRFNGGLPSYNPDTALQFVRSTLSLGYTGGILLVLQALAVQNILDAYKLVDGILLENVSQPYELAKALARVSDAFGSMAMFNYEYASSYAASYKKMAQGWLVHSGQAIIPVEGREGFNLKEITLAKPQSSTYQPLQPTQVGGSLITLAADRYVTNGTITFEIRLLSPSSNPVSATIESMGNAAFIPERIVLIPNKLYKKTFELMDEGYGSAQVKTSGELASNTILFENIPLDFKP